MKLKYLEPQIARRGPWPRRYNKHLAGMPLRVPEDRPMVVTCTTCTSWRPKTRPAERPVAPSPEQGDHGGIHYPNGVHVQPAMPAG